MVLDARFLMYQLMSTIGRGQIERDAHGSSGTMPKITQKHIRSWKILLPPFNEQQRIVEVLDCKLKNIGEATKRAEKQISLVREYRTRLIADVVTGKLDVRNAAVQLPDEVEEPELIDEAETLTDDNGISEVTDQDELIEEADELS
jgi:putative endonuclease